MEEETKGDDRRRKRMCRRQRQKYRDGVTRANEGQFENEKRTSGSRQKREMGE